LTVIASGGGTSRWSVAVNAALIAAKVIAVSNMIIVRSLVCVAMPFEHMLTSGVFQTAFHSFREELAPVGVLFEILSSFQDFSAIPAI
jgi:uncharacterized membrane protein YvlD (DUF360 family)